MFKSLDIIWNGLKYVINLFCIFFRTYINLTNHLFSLSLLKINYLNCFQQMTNIFSLKQKTNDKYIF